MDEKTHPARDRGEARNLEKPARWRARDETRAKYPLEKSHCSDGGSRRNGNPQSTKARCQGKSADQENAESRQGESEHDASVTRRQEDRQVDSEYTAHHVPDQDHPEKRSAAFVLRTDFREQDVSEM